MSKANSSSSSDSPTYSSNQSTNSSKTSFATLCNFPSSAVDSKPAKLGTYHWRVHPQTADDRPSPKYKDEAFSAWKSYIGEDEPDYEHIAWKKQMAGETTQTPRKEEEYKGWKYWAGILKAKDTERKAKEAKLAQDQRCKQ